MAWWIFKPKPEPEEPAKEPVEKTTKTKTTKDPTQVIKQSPLHRQAGVGVTPAKAEAQKPETTDKKPATLVGKKQGLPVAINTGSGRVGGIVQRGKTKYIVSPGHLYLTKYAEPEERKQLQQSLGGSKDEYSQSYMAAYESLTPEEKSGYGYKFTNWKGVPPQNIQHYPGGKRYLESLSSEEKEELITKYMSSKSWTDYISSDKGQRARQAVASSLHEKKITEPGTLIPGWLNPFGGDIKQPQWMADLNVSTIAIYDYPTAERSIAEKQVLSGGDVYSGLGFRTRNIYSTSEAMLSAALYPVTLAQTGVKYVTGKGKITDPLGRIKSGKTFLPDVGKKLAEDKITPTSGVISGSIGMFISPDESRYRETVMKYPIESGSASMGEFIGIYVGGKAVHAGKVTIIKAGHRIGIPSIPAKYNPLLRVRTGYWKARDKLGLAKEVPPETVFQTKALPDKLSFAPGKTPAERIVETIKAFKKTKVLSGTDDYLGVHSSTDPWMKPIAWLRKGRESSGISIAPVGEGSPRFLRLTGDVTPSYSTSGFSLFPKIKLPTAPIFSFSNLRRIPSYLQDKSYELSNVFIKKKPGAYIAPKLYKGGGEYEGILRGFARRLGTKQYTIIDDVAVPFPRFKLIEKGSMTVRESVFHSIPSNVKSFVSPFSIITRKSTISMLSPSYLTSVITESKPSYSSYKKYSMSSSIPSYSVSSSYSKVSRSSYVSDSKISYPSGYKSVSKSSYKTKSSPSIPSSSSPSLPSYSLSSMSSFSSSSMPSVPSYPVPPAYYSSLKIKGTKGKASNKFLDDRYRFREFKLPSLTKVLKNVKF